MTKCAEMPYNELETEDVLAALERGYRLPCPANCSDAMYHVMLGCWRADPHTRPHFTVILDQLNTVLLDERANAIQKQASMRLRPVGSTRHPPQHTQDPNMHRGKSMYENIPPFSR